MKQPPTAQLDPDVIAAAVLAALIADYPAQRSFEELVRALADDPSEFSERDSVRVALRELARGGLVHRHGDFFFATRAAVCAQRLLTT